MSISDCVRDGRVLGQIIWSGTLDKEVIEFLYREGGIDPSIIEKNWYAVQPNQRSVAVEYSATPGTAHQASGGGMSKVSRLGPKSLLQLRIELKHSSPVIWRSVLVPDNITLVKLHRVIQEAMGWYDCHLHEFVIDHRHYGMVDPEEDPSWGIGPELIDEKRKKLEKVLGRNRRFEYLYDYGDSWWHTITLENRLPLTSARPGMVCIGGEMACPPEDVGGLGGYFEFIEAMKDPQHEEHENLMEWWGEAFDPRAFDLIQINKRLKQIKT